MSNNPIDNSVYTSVDKKVALVLFHNDLRVHDNATLLKAAEVVGNNNGRLLCVYAPDLVDGLAVQSSKQAYHSDELGQARAQFLLESLVDLDKSLQRLGNRLLYVRKERSLVPGVSSQALDTFTQLCQLIEQQKATDICVSQTAD